jgi:urocanate hydratase
MASFKKLIREGIPSEIPSFKKRSENLSHAPKRKNILSIEEKNWP